MEQDKEYFVFISYSSLDNEWAIWLRHELEHYHLPASFNGRTDVRDNLRKVFRDRDELSAGPEWDEQVQKALENTNNLIVICSPNAAKSQPVNKEVETFIALGKEDHIFPFIVEGDKPEDCFPRALGHSKLGGDVNKDGGRDSAFIKVVAGLLKVSFPSLWNRYEIEKAEEERKQREQRDNLLKVQSLFLSEKVNDIINQDNALLGTLLALEALPVNLQEPNRPYIYEAEFALRKACSSQSAVLRGHEGGCMWASYSTDGNYIISGASEFTKSGTPDYTIKIWSAADNSILFSLPHLKSVSCASFDNKDSYIVTAGHYNKNVYIWDIKTHQLVRTLEQDGFVESAVFSADGKWVITSSLDNTIRKWNVEDGREVLTIREDVKGFLWALPSPNGKYIVSCSVDSGVRVWDANTGELIKVLCRGTYEPPYAEYSPDGRFIGVAIGTQVTIWDSENLNQLLEMTVSRYDITMFAFSPDGQTLAIADDEWLVGVWKLRYDYLTKSWKGDQIQNFTGHSMKIYSCRFCPDGKKVITASYDQTVRIWDIDEHIVLESEPGKGLLCHVEFSPNGKLMAAAYNDNVIRLFDTTNWELKGELLGHTDYPQSMYFDADGTRLVSTASDKTVRVWDIEESSLLHVFVLFDENASEAHFSPDGEIIAFSAWEHIFVYDTKDWSLLHDIEIKGTIGAKNMSFSPDGSIFVVSQAASLLIYETRTCNLLKSVNLYPRVIKKLSFDPIGKYIYFIDTNTLCRIYVETLSNIEEFDGHTSDVIRYAFSPDMQYVATGSQDNTVRVWDLVNRKTIHIYKGHTSGVSSVNIQPDGRTIFSSSFDGTVRQWDFPPLQELIDKTRERFKNRPLTPVERQKYYLE